MSRQRNKALCSYHSQNSGYKNNLQIWRQIALIKHPDRSHSVFFVLFSLTATQTSFSKPVVCNQSVQSFLIWLPRLASVEENFFFLLEKILIRAKPKNCFVLFLFFPADENFRMRRWDWWLSGMWIFIGDFRECQQVFPPKKNSFLKPRRIQIPKRRKNRLSSFCSFISRFPVLSSLFFFYFYKSDAKGGLDQSKQDVTAPIPKPERQRTTLCGHFYIHNEQKQRMTRTYVL